MRRGSAIRLLLSVALLVGSAGVVGLAFHIAANSEARIGPYTEFFFTGPSNGRDLKVGEDYSEEVGLVNHEGKRMSYEIEAGFVAGELSRVTVVLEDKQVTRLRIVVTPALASESAELELVLFAGSETQPYRTIRRYYRVTGDTP